LFCLLCSPGRPSPRDPPAAASQELGLQTCTITPDYEVSFIWAKLITLLKKLIFFFWW
jgi:hypothetical protein